MQKEILFRAKRKDNGEWVYGCGVYNDGVIAFIINYDVDLIKETSKFEYIQVIPETICQYTGKPDKNGIKIFENDIVKANERYKGIGEVDLLYKVDYIDRLAKYVYNPLLVKGKYDNNNHDVNLYYYETNDIEVIGNIFDSEEVK